MAFDEGLAERLRDVLSDQADLDEKKMFGGLAFMLNGNLACGVIGDEMIVRVGPDGYDTAIAKPNTRVFDFSGKPMKGWIVVAPEGVESDEELAVWARQGVDFATALPPK
jgi:hypothetical protein